MPSSNPALSPSYFENEARDAPRTANVMTVNGAVAKTGILTLLLFAAGALSWSMVHPQTGTEAYNPTYRMLFGVGAPLLGLVVGLITCFFPRVSPITAPIYAALEGLFLGAVSSFVSANPKFEGIVMQAGMLTAGTLIVMLTAYAVGLVRATPRFALIITVAIMGLLLVKLGSFFLSLGGIDTGLYAGGAIGIGFSILCVGVAAFTLVLDFDTIDSGARAHAPKYMEWYAAFGLMVTLIWLYLELLRLLMQLRRSD